MKHYRKALVVCVAGLWATAVLAQADCPTIVQAALEATDNACAGTGRNQACYGNIDLTALPLEEGADLNFETPGDLVEVAGVRTLTLKPLDEVADVWGVAMMRLQANLPDTAPGANVTFLLFGDVEITNAVETNVEPVAFEVVADGDINVRGGPSANDERIGGLSEGQSVTANGRIEDGSWLRIELENGTPGWVSAELVTTDGDITTLNVVDPLALPPPVLTPMQAFYFKTGIGDAPCDEAPDSGILIQTPEGEGQISFTVNDVNIQLGSTIYLQSLPDAEIAVNVVEHQAVVSAQGTTRFVPAGSRVRVPINSSLQASGPPSEPEPYDNADLAALPVDHMPREVTVPTALTAAEIEALTSNLLPVSGDWQYTSGEVTLGGDCAAAMNSAMFPTTSMVVTLDGAFNIDPFGNFSSMRMPEYGNPEFTSSEPGVFVAELDVEGALLTYEIHVLSPTSIEGLTTISINEEGFSCALSIPFTMEAVES